MRRIDPKAFTLDAMQRDDIRRALQLLAEQTERTAQRKRNSPRAHTLSVSREIESLDSRAARVSDLLATFAKVDA